MVLLVKLKNPNRKGAIDAQTGDSAADSTSHEYVGFADQRENLSPPTTATGESASASDQGLDDLSEALQKTNLDEHKTTEDVIDKESVGKTAINTSRLHRPSVDVLIAPAVIGHRWVRTRSNAFVVERPERIRAVLLGVAAVVAKEKVETRAQDNQLDNIRDKLASLSTQDRNSYQSQAHIGIYTSDERLHLSSSSPALAMIHALEGEAITVSDKSIPGSENISSSKEVFYAAYLDKLCTSAPNDVPPALSPSVFRHGASPKKTDAQVSIEPSQHPSEVPLHLSQGDLYLCGPKETVKRQAGDDLKASLTSEMGNALLQIADNEDKTSNEALLSEAAFKGEEAWRQGGSKGAIEAALGTGCAAIDRVVAASQQLARPPTHTIQSIDLSNLEGKPRLREEKKEAPPALRSFVIVRPPGHHCNATQPSGFCWVNNAAVMAAHAYHEHGIDRVAILDFDLHHGNGTQAIAWRINADTVRQDLEREAKRKARRAEQERRGKRVIQDDLVKPDDDKRGLKIFYGSLHDIESFPCEDGNRELVTDASMCIEGAHGQWIWNIHLEAQSDSHEAKRLYKQKYSQLIIKARNFFASTESTPDKSLIIVSAGFDACIHEQAGMQRHGKSVPSQFYQMFSHDAVALAEERCAGKCVSILEGGYSDRALTSATMAHLIGLGLPALQEDIYQTSNLYQLEKVAKSAATNAAPRRKNDALSRDGVWLDYTMEAFQRLEEHCGRKRSCQRGDEDHHLTTPKTPDRGTIEQLWRSPREMRSGKGTTPI